MKRIAFFVEGLTEQLFLIKFIEEVYGRSRIAITSMKGSGGKKAAMSFTTITADSVSSETEYFILIVDCGGDGNLRSYIDDQKASLFNSNYSKIVGVRDVYPNLRSDVEKLKNGLCYKLSPEDLTRITFILSVMEIEAWFLSEHTHFTRIDERLTPLAIHQALSFHPENDDMELRDRPAEDLHKSYQLAGKSYNKERRRVQRTIDAIDFALLYFNTKPQGLNELKGELENFFS